MRLLRSEIRGGRVGSVVVDQAFTLELKVQNAAARAAMAGAEQLTLTH